MLMQSDSIKTLESGSHSEDFKEESKEKESESAKRSLLTQQLRKRDMEVPGDNEDDIVKVEGRIIVRINSLMREIRKESQGNNTEPLPRLSDETNFTFAEHSCASQSDIVNERVIFRKKIRPQKNRLLGDMEMEGKGSR